ncbi:helicase HerA-like domain-containing protein [Streptomyces sp. NPDC057565]|uniref:helicase HerA-like domain-containing protein n=1 Tax=Streptomyces sp. NPDC057565 TaxID=3346169 RepID=UPI003688A3EC
MDRESAYEKLTAEREAEQRAAAEAATVDTAVKAGKQPKAAKDDESLVEQVVGSGVFRSSARSVGTQLGREISRSLFGTARRGR